MKTTISTGLKRDGDLMKFSVVDLNVPDLSTIDNFQTMHTCAHEFIPTLWCPMLSFQMWLPRLLQLCCTHCPFSSVLSLSPSKKGGFLFPISHHLVLGLQGPDLLAAFFSWDSWGGCEPKTSRANFWSFSSFSTFTLPQLKLYLAPTYPVFSDIAASWLWKP